MTTPVEEMKKLRALVESAATSSSKKTIVSEGISPSFVHFINKRADDFMRTGRLDPVPAAFGGHDEHDEHDEQHDEHDEQLDECDMPGHTFNGREYLNESNPGIKVCPHEDKGRHSIKLHGTRIGSHETLDEACNASHCLARHVRTYPADKRRKFK